MFLPLGIWLTSCPKYFMSYFHQILAIIFFCATGSASAQFSSTPVLKFDGIDDYIMLDQAVGDNVRSIELWFNPASDFNVSSPSPQTFFVRDVIGETGEWGLCLAQFANYQGNILFFKNIGNNFYYVISDANSWAQDTWYHVAGVIDPVDGMRLYIDGVLQNSTDPNTSPTDNRNESVTIGNWTNNVGREFHGMMDEVRIWDRAISQQEIIDNMCSLTQWSDSTGLMAYWKFDEGSGTIAIDELMNHSGVISGAVYSTEQYCSINSLFEINSNEITFQISPNPGEDMIELNFSEKIENCTVSIFDLAGKLVLQQDISNVKSDYLNIEALETGTYTLVVRSDKMLSSKSLIKL